MTPNSAPRLALFAYGSLRERKVQRWLFGRAVPATPDSVQGACCRWVDDLDADLFRLTGQRGYPMLWLDANTPTCIDGERLRLSAAGLQRAGARWCSCGRGIAPGCTSRRAVRGADHAKAPRGVCRAGL